MNISDKNREVLFTPGTVTESESGQVLADSILKTELTGFIDRSE